MTRNLIPTREIAAKVLAVVDAGLSEGVGVRKPGFMCVEAAVCYALGLPHGDDPECVSRAVRSLKIRLNDSSWSSKEARAKGLRRLAIAQLGTRDTLDDKEFAKRVAELAIRHCVPAALRAAASVQKDAEHRQKLLDAANRCEAEGTRAAAEAAAVDAAYAAAVGAAEAAEAAVGAAYAAVDADAAVAAAYAAAEAAAYAAEAAAYAADKAAAEAAAEAAVDAAETRDELLSSFAEGVVKILIEMNAPACQFLDITEAA